MENKFQITGSSGVSIGNVSQVITHSTPELPESHRGPKILFLGANPPGTDRLLLDREARAIGEVLRSATGYEPFKLEQSWAVSVHELQDGLLHHQPDILHLSGHGRPDGLLVLDSADMNCDLAMVAPPNRDAAQRSFLPALGRLFHTAKGKLRCVVLNACHSAEAAAVIAESVECVIGMSDSIEDEAALRFSRAFYHAVAHAQSVRAAFEIANAQIGLSGMYDSGRPLLLARRTDPAAVFFVRPGAG
ncbi:MAG TPA: CHAT domain-containing protein [Thermoanaerobaculia bacterium]|nr:CHAT domain-containing protein [Thermoanaerobaculia bacterium]